MTDNRGREITRPWEVRSAVVTAVATLTTGTASTLIEGDTANFLDLVQMSFANNSDAATTVTLGNDGTTIRTIQVPANNTLLQVFDLPIKQLTKNTPWVADLPDITGTTITINAEFIKENN